MPTPESAHFLAQKPKVPPTFDGVDYDDNLQLKAAQDSIIREQWVQSMMARLIREEMGKCYYREGVNHLEKCGHLRGMLCAELRLCLLFLSLFLPLNGSEESFSKRRIADKKNRPLPCTIEALQGQGLPIRATKLRPQVIEDGLYPYPITALRNTPETSTTRQFPRKKEGRREGERGRRQGRWHLNWPKRNRAWPCYV